MTHANVDQQPPNMQDEISVLGVVTLLMKWRRTIAGLGLLGAITGLAVGLLSTRVYQSFAIFIPQASPEGTMSGLAAAASQFGVRLPTSGGSNWGLPVYVELLTSSALLEPMAADTMIVTEQRGKRVALLDLLKVRDPDPRMRRDIGIRKLGKIITATEVRPLEAVKISVTTPWPSVSYRLAQQLLQGLNEFILEKRKSQATAELQFVEGQARDAEVALRASENKLQTFLQQNRSLGSSPELTFERDRLQRDVTLNQQMYGTLLQSREEARIREVRDTPVLTIIEDPRLPLVGEPRNSVQRAVLGGIAGCILGIMIALLVERMMKIRSEPSETTRDFLAVAQDTMPPIAKRGQR
jgi:uncharacterized protein involved in exopolysaccharide biosynthesis